MIVKLLLAGAVIAAISLGAARAEDINVFMTGNRLLDDCRSRNVDLRLFCDGYVEGVVDAFDLERSDQGFPACIPVKVKASQVRDAVLLFLEQHPAERSWPAAQLVIIAIEAAWHCGKP